MTISAKQVMDLRAATGMPMMKCKKALEAEDGDYEKAMERLRKEGMKSADARADRATGEGVVRIQVSDDGKAGCLVTLACETEPVSKTPMFSEFADRLIEQVATTCPANVDELVASPWIDDAGKSVADALKDVQMRITENMRVQDVACLSVDGDGLVGAYLHHTAKDGTLVALVGKNLSEDMTDFAKKLGMHIVSSKPLVISRDQVPAKVLEKEKEIARAQVEQDPKMANKPAQVIEKIVDGKVAAFYQQAVLKEQPWVLDPAKTVAAVLKEHGVDIQAFHRAHLGA